MVFIIHTTESCLYTSKRILAMQSWWFCSTMILEFRLGTASDEANKLCIYKFCTLFVREGESKYPNSQNDLRLNRLLTGWRSYITVYHVSDSDLPIIMVKCNATQPNHSKTSIPWVGRLEDSFCNRLKKSYFNENIINFIRDCFLWRIREKSYSRFLVNNFNGYWKFAFA